jgi:16S rRNA (guanine966-N2)-methyltransferase
VLDLFAGTGALGIEALSRGAEFAIFVDNHKSALSLIKRNIRSCALDHRARLIQWNIIHNLNCIRFHRPAFNLVFIDPPYNENMLKPVLRNLHHSQCLEKDTCIVVEHADSESIPEDLLPFRMKDQRSYGKTLVSFLDYMI